MAQFTIEAVIVVQERYEVTIEADTLEEAQAKAEEAEHDLSLIAEMAGVDFDPGDAWLELETLEPKT